MIDLRPDPEHDSYVSLESVPIDPASASWALTLTALDSLRCHGKPYPGEEIILRRVRQQLRGAMLREAERPTTRWVVPAAPEYLTAAYLVALVFTRRGEGVRVWPWPQPAPGPVLIIGSHWSQLLQPLHAGAA